MSNKIIRTLLISILLLTFSSPQLIGASSNSVRASSAVATKPNVETKQLDKRAKILAEYFALHNSPLQYQAQDFVDAADKNGLDWKLVAAISGVESTFGKASYGYNAWGWGIYGSNRLGFKSWTDGIYTVSQGLRENYVNKGLTNPYSMNRVYAKSKSWGWKVDYFMKDMGKLEDRYEPKAKTANPQLKTAAASAQLAWNGSRN